MKKLAYFMILVFLLSCGLIGQSTPAAFDNAEKKTVIEGLCENLEREYIFPEITEKYVRMLRENLRSGKYDRIAQPQEFARTLTEDLRAIHADAHLTVWYNPEWVKNERGRKALDEEAIRLQKRRDRARNYGFQEIKILPGNIGYFKFNGFSYDTDAYEPAIGAMSCLANVDALIIDLRTNGGGSPEMVQFLCSYFLDNPRKHLNSFSYKDADKLTQYWTYTYLPGRRLDKVDLYLLTSARTFSAAEEFTYNLKNMKRAVVIGETTGGGAHDNKFVILSDNFEMSLPFARAVNPITKTNWEEVGVEPDIKVSADRALDKALVMASKKLADKENEPEFKASYKWYGDAYEATSEPVAVAEETLRSYVGTYGARTITLEDGSLFYQREGRPKMKLIPIAEDDFMLEGVETFRLRFIEDGGRVVAVEAHDMTGQSDKSLRDK
jgi:hypothetical protein